MNEVPGQGDKILKFPIRKIFPHISEREAVIDGVADRIGFQGMLKSFLHPEDETVTAKEDRVIETLTPLEHYELLRSAVANSVFEDLGISAEYDECPEKVKSIIDTQTNRRLQFIRQTEADLEVVRRLMPEVEE